MMRLLSVLAFVAMLLTGADLNGTWNFTVHTPKDGTGMPVVIFKQTGNVLTGSYMGRLGDLELEGSIKDGHFMFTVKTPGGELHFVGTVDSDGRKASGTFSAGSIGDGDFSAVRK